MYKLPMFGCSDPSQVLAEIANATKTFPDAYIRWAAPALPSYSPERLTALNISLYCRQYVQQCCKVSTLMIEACFHLGHQPLHMSHSKHCPCC